MELGLIKGIFIVLLFALAGGFIAKSVKVPPVVGYIVAGIVSAHLVPFGSMGVDKLAELGSVLLMFSVGLELTLSRITRLFKVAIIGGFLEILVCVVIFFLLFVFLGFEPAASLLVAFVFSLSSTALVVKILSDKGELNSIHGQLMVAWLLIQDLAVVPVMALMPVFVQSSQVVNTFAIALFKAIFIIAIILILGRIVIPFILHRIASENSRELLVLSSVLIAIGTAIMTSFFGVSYAIGAFLAGIVISDTHENHAVFSETRPLRDLFVAMFFVTLGLFIDITTLLSNLPLIILILLTLILTKFLVFMFISFVLGYHGKTSIRVSLGLTQVGEFGFFILTQALVLKIIDQRLFSVAAWVAIMSLMLTPVMFRWSNTIWRKLRFVVDKNEKAKRYFVGYDRRMDLIEAKNKNHIIVCGYGRVGRWVVKALDSLGVDFVVVDYNRQVLRQAEREGIKVLYGDPSETDVLEKLNIQEAKVVVVAIPDRLVQEELITKVQTIAPNVKIISRAHLDEDYDRFKFLKVDKIVQPEFEASMAITKTTLSYLGKSPEFIKNKIKSLRQSKSLS